MRSALYLKSLRDHWRSIVGWTLGVVVLVVVQLSVYPTVRSSSGDWSELVDTFPDVFKEVFRIQDYASEEGYLATELLSFVVPFLFMGLGASWGARVTTEDEESGTADILLALPVSRTAVILTRLAAALTPVGLMAAAFVTSLVVGTAILDFSIPVHRYIASGFVLASLGWLLACIATLLGSLTGRRGASLGLSMGAAVAAFVLYSLAPLVEVFDSILFLNPLQWTIGSSPLTEGPHWGYALLTLGLASLSAAFAVVVYRRRDIAG